MQAALMSLHLGEALWLCSPPLSLQAHGLSSEALAGLPGCSGLAGVHRARVGGMLLLLPSGVGGQTREDRAGPSSH